VSQKILFVVEHLRKNFQFIVSEKYRIKIVDYKPLLEQRRTIDGALKEEV